MKAVDDLDRLGYPPANPAGVEVAPIATDSRDRRMSDQPGGLLFTKSDDQPTLFTPVGSKTGPRERCNSVCVNTALPKRRRLVFYLRPRWWHFQRVHSRRAELIPR